MSTFPSVVESAAVPRRIGVVTVARSDWGHLLPLLEEIRATPGLELRLFVAGSHLDARFGETAALVEAGGFTIAERIDLRLEDDTPPAIARALGTGVSGFADSLARTPPDILVLLGDRYEMLGAAVAALPLNLPVAHLHGGEVTEGVIDEQIRHALTKLAHLHFAAAPEYARRILQMGEEPWRVHCPGAPGLDRFRTMTWLSREALRARLGLALGGQTLLVTYHPVTLELEASEAHLVALVTALAQVGGEIVVTYPGADAASQRIIETLRVFAGSRRDVRFVPSLGDDVYCSLMRVVDAMVGNSSSGIIEAASFGLPVVNIGNRQRGRVRAGNVIDVAPSRAAILEGIRRAVDPAFRRSVAELGNPYGDGHAAPRIVKVLSEVDVGPRLLVKRFVDAPAPGS